MKTIYPIVLTPGSDFGYVVYVPDFEINTEGKDLNDALFMANDAICMMGNDMEDDGKALPLPSRPENIKLAVNETLALVEVDFDDYRRKHDTRTVRKNCTIPGWLNEAASKAGLNFSKVLQDGLIRALGITL
jgi:predicted RNase H-like HicB family nuclease